MKYNIYIKDISSESIREQKLIIHRYIQNNNIELPTNFSNDTVWEHVEIENDIDVILNNLPEYSHLMIAGLYSLGNSSVNILKSIDTAFKRKITIHSAEDELCISYKNKELPLMILSLLKIEDYLKNKKLAASKITHEKNKTKTGRKPGKKAKSMFDKYKRKIMKLNKEGVPKTKILDEIKQDNPNLQGTSAQALGQYIKKIEKRIADKNPFINLEKDIGF